MGRRGRRADLHQVLDRGDPAADDGDAAPGELLGPAVLSGVELEAPEGLLAPVAGPERPLPGAGGVDERPCGPDAAVGLDLQAFVGQRFDRPDRDRALDPQVECALVFGEVLGDDLGDRGRLLGGGNGHVGELVDAVDGLEGQRRPAVLPGPAGARVVVEDDEAGLGLEVPAQGVRGRQAGLTGPDDDHFDFAPHVRFNRDASAPIP